MRKGEMLSMEGKGAYDCKIQYSIVELSDCVINCLLQQLETIMAHRFIGYEPFKGDSGRNKGSLISMEMEKQFLILSINYKIVVSSSLTKC
jgi:GTP-binding protein